MRGLIVSSGIMQSFQICLLNERTLAVFSAKFEWRRWSSQGLDGHNPQSSAVIQTNQHPAQSWGRWHGNCSKRPQKGRKPRTSIARAH